TGAGRCPTLTASRPARCFAEPTSLKLTRDSIHRWMKEGAQVTSADRHMPSIREKLSLYFVQQSARFSIDKFRRKILFRSLDVFEIALHKYSWIFSFGTPVDIVQIYMHFVWHMRSLTSQNFFTCIPIISVARLV